MQAGIMSFIGQSYSPLMILILVIAIVIIIVTILVVAFRSVDHVFR